MNRTKFLRLAREVFVPHNDPDQEIRAAIHAHINKVQTDLYEKIRMNIIRLRKLPSVTQIEAYAWKSWRNS